jgi:hypothetical protein
LAFARSNIERLDSFSRHWRENDDRVIRLQDKVCTEAALLLLLARRASPGRMELDKECTALGELLAPAIRTGRLRHLLVCSPQVAATLGAGHIFLTDAGFPDASFDELVLGNLEAGFAETVERVPYRLLDQRWTRNLLRQRPQSFDDLLPLSILDSRAHPFYMTETDAYAATHAIMYLTDFGRAPLPAGLDAMRVSALVDSGLAWHVLSEDFDLLVEFLMDAGCLGMAHSPCSRFAWQLVDHIWTDFGFLPGPTFNAAEYKTLSGEAAAAYAFQHLYHTNFVGGMLCAVSLLHPDATQETPDTILQEAAPLEYLLGCALGIRGTKCSQESAWFKLLPNASVADGELMRIVSDAALIEAARRSDWAMLERIRMECRCWKIPATATMREADWLCERLRTHGISGT